MSEELTITHERVDDLPVLLAQLERMQVAPLLDAHFPTHGNWQGLSTTVKQGADVIVRLNPSLKLSERNTPDLGVLSL